MFGGSKAEVTHHDDPRDAATRGVPFALPEDASLVDAWTVGEPTDSGPEPIHLAIYNATGEPAECSTILTVNGTDRVDTGWSLDADEYVRFTLSVPHDYVAAVGHRSDLQDVVVGRNEFDCNEKTVTAEVAADGRVEIARAKTDLACESS
jgi:hypothetical protein